MIDPSRLVRIGRTVFRAARAQWFLRGATRVSRSVRLNGRAVVRNRGVLSVGDRVRLAGHVSPLEFDVGPGAQLSIGDGSFLNFGTFVRARDAVSIGDGCQIGTYCVITDNLGFDEALERRDEPGASRPVRIGSNVWLASRVVVMPGVTIGDDSVVGAGSVVEHDVPPATLVAGAPARVIRSL